MAGIGSILDGVGYSVTKCATNGGVNSTQNGDFDQPGSSSSSRELSPEARQIGGALIAAVGAGGLGYAGLRGYRLMKYLRHLQTAARTFNEFQDHIRGGGRSAAKAIGGMTQKELDVALRDYLRNVATNKAPGDIKALKSMMDRGAPPEGGLLDRLAEKYIARQDPNYARLRNQLDLRREFGDVLGDAKYTPDPVVLPKRPIEISGIPQAIKVDQPPIDLLSPARALAPAILGGAALLSAPSMVSALRGPAKVEVKVKAKKKEAPQKKEASARTRLRDLLLFY